MEPDHCLNCTESLVGKFCSTCGQKSATHRITIKHFVMHDLMHGVWHLEKGILFTLKEALMRPGQAALDYIAGKRIRYYNVFYLSLLLTGLHIILVYIFGKLLPEAPYNAKSLTVIDFLSRNVKFIVLGFVPMLAINSMIFFRRLKLNFAEHLILGGMSLLGILMLNILFYVFNILTEITQWKLFAYFEVATFFGMLLFPLWSYWNATKQRYPKFGRIWRVVSFYVVLLIEVVLIMTAIIYLLTNQTQFEFSL